MHTICGIITSHVKLADTKTKLDACAHGACLPNLYLSTINCIKIINYETVLRRQLTSVRKILNRWLKTREF